MENFPKMAGQKCANNFVLRNINMIQPARITPPAILASRKTFSLSTYLCSFLSTPPYKFSLLTILQILPTNSPHKFSLQILLTNSPHKFSSQIFFANSPHFSPLTVTVKQPAAALARELEFCFVDPISAFHFSLVG